MADAISIPKGGLDYGGGELCSFTLSTHLCHYAETEQTLT